MFIPQDVIRKKRNGAALDQADIARFVQGIAENSVSEGQIAALAMAIYFQGMTRDEAVALTLAMRDSGKVLDWRGFSGNGPIIDKHSTGGVGDLVSLVLGPMVAACGGFVPMISGRGLGHTGGTLDKLDAIPGYQSTPTIERFRETVKSVGVAIIGQTDDLAPADRRFYATRDVTATVESIPLITASILSKKLAAGLGGLVMDVKVGSGAFMPTLEKSRELAASIVAVGNGAGLRTSAILSDMNEPLAPCAGNAIEVRAAIDYLTGAARPKRLHEVTLALAGELLVIGGLAKDTQVARIALQKSLDSGHALERFEKMVAALGGPSNIASKTRQSLEFAPIVVDVKTTNAGTISGIDTYQLGMAVVALGGGRLRPQDKIDYAVGLDQCAPIGTQVRAGDVIARVQARDAQAAARGVQEVLRAYRIACAVQVAAPVIETIHS